MRQLPCPHCFETPYSLDMHLRFHCPKLIGRSRYVAPEPSLVVAVATEFERQYWINAPADKPVLRTGEREKFFADIEEFLAKPD